MHRSRQGCCTRQPFTRPDTLPSLLGGPAGKAHCVSGSDYAHVRVGAFMGLRICSELAAEQAAGSSGGGSAAAGSTDVVPVIGALLLTFPTARTACKPAPAWATTLPSPPCCMVLNSSCGLHAGGGYLANVPPSQFASRFEEQLPEALSGAEFLQRYAPHLDRATSVDPEQVSWGAGRALAAFGVIREWHTLPLAAS